MAAADDHPDAVVCRIGGDEFCVVLGGIDHTDDAIKVASRAADEARRLDQGARLSCGIALAGGDIPSSNALLRAADRAQYQAKRDGLGVVVFEDSTQPLERADSGRRSLRDRS